MNGSFCKRLMPEMLLSFLTTLLFFQVLASNDSSNSTLRCTGMATRRGRRIAMDDRVGAWDFGCPDDATPTRGSPGYSVWAVFDGHGSAAVSSYLVAALHRHLQRRLCAASTSGDDARGRILGRTYHEQQRHVRAALVHAFNDADLDLRRTPTASATPETSGSDGDGDDLEELRAAAVAAAWDSGSTAVVAVADWTWGAADCGTYCRNGARPTVAAAADVNAGGQAAPEPALARGADTEASTSDKHSKEAASAGCSSARTMNAGSSSGAAYTGSCCDDAADGLLGALWVANVGNSPAILCAPAEAFGKTSTAAGPDATGERTRRRMASDASANGGDGGGFRLMAELLTESHELSAESERRRVEAAGGRVEEPTRPGGKRRLMGDLEVSRAFGDLQYRQVGLIAEPDVLGPWLLYGDSCNGSSGDRGGRSLCGSGCSVGVGGFVSTTNDSSVDRTNSNITSMRCNRSEPAGSCSGGSGSCSSGSGSRSDGSVAPRAREPHEIKRLLPLLLLASDGVLDVMMPEDMCNHVSAQLLGAAHPPLTPPLPPAIPLGPVAPAGQPPSLEATVTSGADDTHGKPGGSPPAGAPILATRTVHADEDGLPGCCDCELHAMAALQATIGLEHPCAEQALSRPAYRHPAQRTETNAAVRLVQEAVNRGSMDNVAAVVVQLPGSIRARRLQHDIGCSLEDPAGGCTCSGAAPTGSIDSTAAPKPFDLGQPTQASSGRQAEVGRKESLASALASAVDIGVCGRHAPGAIGGATTAGGDEVLAWPLEGLATAHRSAAVLNRCRARGQLGPAAPPAPVSSKGGALLLPGRNDGPAGGGSDGISSGRDRSSMLSGTGARLLLYRYFRQVIVRLQRLCGATSSGSVAGGDGRAGSGAQGALMMDAGASEPRAQQHIGSDGGGGGVDDSDVGGGNGGSVVLVCPPRQQLQMVARQGSSLAACGHYGKCAAARGNGCTDGREDGHVGCNGKEHAGEEREDEGWVDGMEEEEEEGYGYLLAERISAVPSMPYHLHAPTPGGDALPPWRLSDFAGAATFVLPGLSGATTGWLLDRLHSYYSGTLDMYDTFATRTAVVAGTGGGECEVPLECPTRAPQAATRSGGSAVSGGDGSNAHALTLYGSTHSLLLEIASVPLHLALSDGSSAATATGPSAKGSSSSSSSSNSSSSSSSSSSGQATVGMVSSTYLIGGMPDSPANAEHTEDGHPATQNAGNDGFGSVSGRTSSADSAGVAEVNPDDGQLRTNDVPKAWDRLQGRPPPASSSDGGVDDAGCGLGMMAFQLVQPADPGVAAGMSLAVSGRRGRTLMRVLDGGDHTLEEGSGGGGDGGMAASYDEEVRPLGAYASGQRAADVTVMQAGGGASHVRHNDDGGLAVTAAHAAASAAGPAGGVIAGPQLHFQPRAHGVRQADGVMHLITPELGGVSSDGRDAAAAAAAAATAATTGGAGTGDGSGSGSLGGGGSDGEATALAHVYRLLERFGQGHFGEVWRAWRLDRSPLQLTGGTTVQDDGGWPGKGRGRPSGQPAAGTGGAEAADSRPGYVLKRLRGDGGAAVLLSGLRESYFGDVLQRLRGSAATVGWPTEAGGEEGHGDRGFDHLVYYVESFEVVPETTGSATSSASEPDVARGVVNDDVSDGHVGGGTGPDSSGSAPPADLWLVFGDAGRSLHDLIYSPVGLQQPMEEEVEEDVEEVEEDGSDEQQQATADGAADGGGGAPSFEVMGPSAWWHAMRRHPRGNGFIRGLLRQLLLGLQVVHEANITHRDIKPENMMLARMSTRGSHSAGADDPEGTEADSQHGQQGYQQEKVPQAGLSPWRRLSAWTLRSLAGDRASEDDVVIARGAERPRRDDADEGGPGCSTSGSGDGGVLAPVWLRLIDFGSAVDSYSLQHLYGSEGPTSDQLTLEYAPPEALFGRYWEGMLAMRPRAWTYDIWSVGVVWLELLMATPQVWQLPAATRALLEVRLSLQSRPESERHMVFLLRGLMEWCIYPPQAPSMPHSPPLRGRQSRLLMSWSCTEEALLALAKSRDPLGLGFEGPMALRLLLRLLHWDPASRPSARQALHHAFFTVDPTAWTAHVCGTAVVGEPGWC